jgi:hypothetical protein
MTQKKRYNVTAVHEGRDGKAYFKEVGKLFMDETGRKGTLVLHILPGVKLPVFLDDKEKKGASAPEEPDGYVDALLEEAKKRETPG